MTETEANKKAIQMMTEADDATLRNLEKFLMAQYSKYNSGSELDTNFMVLAAIAKQIENVRTELKLRGDK